MSLITLDRDAYRDKVLACWLGKNIVGTLGMPYECKKHTHNLTRAQEGIAKLRRTVWWLEVDEIRLRL